MIVVLADDLSGAAELAGLTVQHGLSAEVQTAFSADSGADVVCVDTDSRLLPAAEAAMRLAGLTRQVLAARPDWIFKKCDSVLRGSVLAEARAVATAAGCSRLLLVPANPRRQRIIRDGVYLIEGHPLSATAFARDPHHPCTSSRVADLLAGDLTGVFVPDIANEEDIERQARFVDSTTLPVGAADFFRTMLTVRTTPGSSLLPPPPASGSQLLVCGSAAGWTARSAEARSRGIDIHARPLDVTAIRQSLEAKGQALVGIGDGPQPQPVSPHDLTRELAQAVTEVLDRARPGQLLLEGGATAAAVMRRLNWTRLRVAGLLADLAAFEPVGHDHAPTVFIKPGSYPWPGALWPDTAT